MCLSYAHASANLLSHVCIHVHVYDLFMYTNLHATHAHAQLWRWKRRGGGVGWEEEGLPLSTIALYELQNVPLPDEEDDELAARRAEIEASSKEDRVTSVLLDNLNLTDGTCLKL